MKRFTILWIFSMILACNVAFGQSGCVLQGRVSVNGSFPTGPTIYFYSPDLMTLYDQYNLNSGYFNNIVIEVANADFVMVVEVPGQGFYIYPSNGNGSSFSTMGCSGFTNLPGFDFNSPPYTYPITGTPCTPLACVLNPLPVELLSFTARAEESSVRLEWATATEEDNEYFTVERSLDGANFEALDDIPGAGTAVEQQNYTWIDESPVPGVNYYRIKQTDFDGAFSYSDVASVRMNGTLGQEMRLFPNPTQAQVRISLPSVGKSGTATLRVFNHVGQMVLSREMSTEGQLLELDTSALPGGIYTLHVQEGTRNYSGKLIVQ